MQIVFKLFFYADKRINMQSKSELNFQVSAPGKVILLGEHSVVYGKTALAASLGHRTSLLFTCSDVPDNKICLLLPMIGVDQWFTLEDIRKLLALPFPVQHAENFNWLRPELIKVELMTSEVREFLKGISDRPFNHGQECALVAFLFLLRGIFATVNVGIGSFSMEVTSDLSIGAGTGSSASYGVCLAAALYNYLRYRVKNGNYGACISKEGFKPSDISSEDLTLFSDKEVGIILSWALLSDEIMHGNPSGIDATVITYGKMIEFRRGEGGTKIARVPPMNILLVNTRVTRDTKRLVSQVAELRGRLPRIIDPILEAMDHIALAAKELFIECEAADETTDTSLVSQLGELMRMNHSLLSTLGVSHPSLDDICCIAKRHGLAAKLTGAGGGGYAIVLLPSDASEARVEALRAELSSTGYDAVLAVMGGNGVQLHATR